MASCKIMQYPKTADEMERFFTKVIGPLLVRHWAEEDQRTGQPHGLDVPAFLAAWEQRGVMVIMAFEGDTPVGFMFVYVFRPLFLAGTVMQVERWHAEHDGVDKEMFDYLSAIAPAMGINHIHAIACDARPVPEGIKTDAADSYQMVKLVV
ncbi:hypothetical protein ABL236_003809 [Escherichia coli]|nr:hypothetical protein [Escherichia coli]EGM5719009.1 hypothetical protein [Escherichia coli]EKB0188126.1 hypothetical protein [Escherichia coli]